MYIWLYIRKLNGEYQLLLHRHTKLIGGHRLRQEQT